MIHPLEIALTLVCMVVALELLARRAALPSPFLLLPAGILFGYLPYVPHVSLDPDLVLYVFLPPLVYVGAALGSWSQFRRNLRPIALLALGCVLVTTLCVASAAHRFLPGGWAAAFVLGAIVSPPDDVAAISIARRLGIPKDLSAILENEGLVNDAMALTLYRFAVAAILTHSFSLTRAVGSFAVVVAGETAWGLLVGWGLLRIRRCLRNPSLEICLSLLTPFIAFLPAVRLGGTGVLATAAAGLYVGYMSSHLVRASTRLQVIPVWQIIEFILNGTLFLVAGMQLPRILEPLSHSDHRLLWAYGVGISLLVIAVRILWVFAATGLLGRLGITMRPGEPNPRWQRFFIVSWSGMRGAISLAAALAISLSTGNGSPFPGRDLIIFITFCVIVSTLLVQGLSLPWLIRLLHIDREGRLERAETGHKEVEARRQAAEAALALLAARRAEGVYPEIILDRLADQYRERHSQFRSHLAGDHEGALQDETHRFNLQTELLESERRVILQLRQAGAIDDDILRSIEKDLDLQEMRLRQGIAEYELFPTP
jgi:CPA1 family monovalent cation:H+ antiporter